MGCEVEVVSDSKSASSDTETRSSELLLVEYVLLNFFSSVIAYLDVSADFVRTRNDNFTLGAGNHCPASLQ